MQQLEDFGLSLCTNCGEQYPACILQEHLTICVLQNLQINCQYCGELILQVHVKTHNKNCKALNFQDVEDDFCEYCKEKIFKQFKQDHYAECPLKQVADAYQSYKSQECPICLTDIGPADQKGVLQCCHVFHQNCLLQWQQKSKECPVCRYN